jgi:hypothetical protein
MLTKTDENNNRTRRCACHVRGGCRLALWRGLFHFACSISPGWRFRHIWRMMKTAKLPDLQPTTFSLATTTIAGRFPHEMIHHDRRPKPCPNSGLPRRNAMKGGGAALVATSIGAETAVSVLSVGTALRDPTSISDMVHNGEGFMPETIARPELRRARLRLINRQFAVTFAGLTYCGYPRASLMSRPATRWSGRNNWPGFLDLMLSISLIGVHSSQLLAWDWWHLHRAPHGRSRANAPAL